MSCTREPLHISFCVVPGHPTTLIFLRCVVSNATNNNILVGQQALYPLNFGLDNMIEEAWIRPRWSAGNGWRELILFAFATPANIATPCMVFECGATIDTLPCGSILLEEIYAFMNSIKGQREVPPRRALVYHPKDPLPPWRDSTKLFQRCKDIVLSLCLMTPVILVIPLRLAHPIPWHPPDDGITFVELFGALALDWRPFQRLASRCNITSMWTIITCPSLWLAIVCTNQWYYTHSC